MFKNIRLTDLSNLIGFRVVSLSMHQLLDERNKKEKYNIVYFSIGNGASLEKDAEHLFVDKYFQLAVFFVPM